jgi:actin-related protein
VAAQIFFDTFNVPALFTSVQAVLSLYASLLGVSRLSLIYISDIHQAGQPELSLTQAME